MDEELQAVAENLQKLMGHHDHSQAYVANKAGIAQRTVSGLLNPTPGHSPVLSKVNAVAGVYGLKGWQLMISGLPLDVLLGAARMHKVVQSYSLADDEGRRYIERVSEKEHSYLLDPPRASNED